jgi:2-polyprenyl-3-methyl-5-hydroxy-6-metoxy-1,4-benzoquinol methylase
MKSTLYSLYCVITGRGGNFLAHKREYHRRRQEMERQIINEALTSPNLFKANTCPVCEIEKEPAKRFKNKVGFSFAVCADCKTIYIDPAPTEETLQRLYNDPAESFIFNKGNEGANVSVIAGHDEDYNAILRMMSGKPKEHLRLLEVGCANGSFLMTANETFDVEGVELNDATAEVARQNGFRVKTGRINDIEGESVYDLIVMLQVLEHIVKPGELIRDALRLLKPGGYLYVDVPNVDSASFNYLGELHVHISSYGHVSMFNRESLIRLCEKNGLEFVTHEFCGGRDLELHDVLSLKLAKESFSHRMALYNPRLYFADKFLKDVTFDLVGKLVLPRGNESYQRALFRKPYH